MNPLKIPNNYIKTSINTHIQNIINLGINSKFKIDDIQLNNFINNIYTNNKLTFTNITIVTYGILFTIENIIRNQNITHPFGFNSTNSKPNSGNYEFDKKTGVYHSHILNDVKSKQTIVLIWYVLKETDDEEYLIRFKYIPHPDYRTEYMSIIHDIYNEEYAYHIDKEEYFEGLTLENKIYKYDEFIKGL
jgi:hypothetical protein